VFILLVLSTIIYGQKPKTFEKLKTFPKESNVIVIITNDTIDLAFKKM